MCLNSGVKVLLVPRVVWRTEGDAEEYSVSTLSNSASDALGRKNSCK
jgi:hypothetical protein